MLAALLSMLLAQPGMTARTPLNPRITGTLRRSGYRVEKLVFESRPRLYVTANVYVPEGPRPPFPAVVGRRGEPWTGMVKRGFVVLAYDPPGRGERPENPQIEAQCALTGTSLEQWDAWDAMRAVDYLRTRPEVDAKRIAPAVPRGAEPDAEIIPEADLRCLTGPIPGAETVQSLNAALAQRLYAARRKDGDLRALLGITGPRGRPPWDTREEVEGPGYRVERIEMQPEPGILIGMLEYVPAGGARRKSAVLWLDAPDTAAIEALLKTDTVVLAAPPRSGSPEAARRALLLGKPLIGKQVYDALRAFDWLAARHEVDSRRITVTGRGAAGVVAIFARAAEPRIAAVSAPDAPRSYLDLAREPAPKNLFEIAVPGILRYFDLPDLSATPAAAR